MSPHLGLGISSLGRGVPQRGLGNSLLAALGRNKDTTPTCPYLGPRLTIQQWKLMGADNVLLSAINIGVKGPLHSIPTKTHQKETPRNQEMENAIGEYLKNNTVRPLNKAEAERTQIWTPVFPRPKKNSEKVRVITDLRALNSCHHIPKHKQETWKSVQTLLQDKKLKWGLTLDLKNFYHHLQMHPKMQRWMRFKMGTTGYQILGMPFGWALSPWWANKFIKPIRSWLQNAQIPHAWWIDDILIMGETKEQTEQNATRLVEILTSLGIQINTEKSDKEATMQIKYVGQHINLQEMKYQPLKEKTDMSIAMIKKQMEGKRFQPRNLAALAGQLIDQTKNNVALQGLPQQLSKQAAAGVMTNVRKYQTWNRPKIWGTTVEKPPQLKRTLEMCLKSVEEPVHRTIRPTNVAEYNLLTDASQKSWGVTLKRGKREVATATGWWGQVDRCKHITHKEAKASALGLIQMIPTIKMGSHVHIQSDATSTVYTWLKGSKVEGLNTPIRHALIKAHQKKLHITATHIPGKMNQRADWLSRNPDCKNYRLDREVYMKACFHFQFYPNLDLFASRANRQTKHFCSWRTDLMSMGNAFGVTWTGHRCWMNPPWDIIAQALQKLKKDKATALVCLPMWQTTQWWRILQTMMVSTPLVVKGVEMYTNPENQKLPPPRWATLFAVIKG